MKKITIISLAAVILLASEVDEIDKIVQKINSKRVGTLPKKELSSVISPMIKIVVEKNETVKDNNKSVIKTKVKDDNFVLAAILNNSAFINGNWYKVGDMVGKYKLIEVMDDSVLLKNGKKTKLILFKENNNKIKITIGR